MTHAEGNWQQTLWGSVAPAKDLGEWNRLIDL